jgi:hypothetical protein
MVGWYHRYVVYVITPVVLANHPIFIIVGQYHRYIVYLITSVVPANHPIFILISRYHRYIVYLITPVVPANHPIFIMVGQYHRYIVYLITPVVLADHDKMGWLASITSAWYCIFDYHVYCLIATPIILIQEYNIGSVGLTQICIPLANHWVVPHVQLFVHAGETRCATIFD